MSQRSIETAARLARLLCEGGEPDELLAAAASVLREGTGAERVAIWRGDPTGAFHSVAAPGGVDAVIVAGIEFVPPGGERIVLQTPGSGPVGVLQLHGDDRSAPALIGIAADLLAPYLTTLRAADERAAEALEYARVLDETRRFMGLIIDALPLGLYVVDQEYRIQIWNRKRETGTQGIRRASALGRTVFDVLTRQPKDQLRAEFDRVLKTGALRQTETEIETPEGRRTYRLTRIPMRLDGDAVTHVITIGEDVSEWRDVQSHILQSEKLAALGQLAAGIMHEINNPLATIAACVAAGEGRLADVTGSGAPALREYLTVIDKEVERCTNIVNGLLDFSRPKGKTKAPSELNHLVDETLGLLRHHSRFKSIALTRELDAGLPPVIVNAEQIIQVLMALSINALDAMEGGGRLTVRTGLSRRRAGEVLVEVEDTGPGVSSSVQSKIFDPFFTTKAPGRGTGLGLSICYGIVEEHRGRIEVDSAPGRGATFRVYLPVGL